MAAWGRFLPVQELATNLTQPGAQLLMRYEMDRRSFLFGATSLVTTGFVPAEADAAIWRHLGTRKVGFFVDHDTIHVGGAAGRYDKIRFRVRGNAIWMYDLNVRYGNGSFDDIPTRFRVPQGGYSRVIDLRGGERYLRSVSFLYRRAVNGRGPAYIELWGRR